MSGPDFVLYLGGIGFQEFEIPEEIHAGGDQAVMVRKYPGGVRTVDTMGPDDDPITWSGTFFDQNAMARCQQIDVMRRQGQPVTVSWAAYQYQVIVQSFKWTFKHFWQIDYTISLLVIQDQTQPIPSTGQDTDSLVNSDLDDCNSDASIIGDSSLSSMMSGITATIQSVVSVTNGTVKFRTGLLTQVGNALARSTLLQGQNDAAMTAAGNSANFRSGISPGQMIAALTGAGQTSTVLAANVDCTNKLSRMSLTISNIGS